jgi:hypothetical protein
MQFWEMSFYSDVQLQIRNLYLSHEDSKRNNSDLSPITDSSSTDTVTYQVPIRKEDLETHLFFFLFFLKTTVNESSHHNGTTTHEKTALEIAADQVM